MPSLCELADQDKSINFTDYTVIIFICIFNIRNINSFAINKIYFLARFDVVFIKGTLKLLLFR